MKLSPGDSDSAQPHHGLLILGIGAVIFSLLSSLPEGILFSAAGRENHGGRCLYQLFVEDVCQGTVALNGPGSLEAIARAFGCKYRPKRDGKIPCGTAVRLWRSPPRHSLEKIPGAYLLRADQRIDINCADAADLEAVPGIGPVLAERIVRYRVQHGPFADVTDLASVGGISRKRVQSLRPYLKVGSSRCDGPEHVEPVGRFTDPAVRRDQKETTGSQEIRKSDAGGY